MNYKIWNEMENDAFEKSQKQKLVKIELDAKKQALEKERAVLVIEHRKLFRLKCEACKSVKKLIDRKIFKCCERIVIIDERIEKLIGKEK